jgi:crotonobetainyl-CoA:carnitine CoA-transferase CaiB-like acyl-CoA transferase
MGQLHRGSAPYRVFRTRDGWITLGASKEKFWRALCGIIGLPELATDPRFEVNAKRVANNAVLIPLIQARLETQDSAHWLAALGDAGIPSEPVLSYDEALAHPQAQARGVVTEVAGRPAMAPPVRLGGTPASVRWPAPELGEHGAEIRAWLEAG